MKKCCSICYKYQAEEIGDSDYGAVYSDILSCSDYKDCEDDIPITNFDRTIERLCCVPDFWKVIEEDTELSEMFDAEMSETDDGNFDKTFNEFKKKYGMD